VTSSIDVAIVGGGPAGAATAIQLAQLGYRVTVFERHVAATWRACGVFASPLVRSRLADLDFAQAEIGLLQQPIWKMELQSTSGASCTLEYRNGPACGFDRVALDAALLERASRAGAHVRRGAVVRDVRLSDNECVIDVSTLDDRTGPSSVRARIVVGADGGGSRVARAANAVTERNWLGRAGITFHVRDSAANSNDAVAGRFVFGRGWYVGDAPVPGNRRNIGIVVPSSRLKEGVDSLIASTSRLTVAPLDEPQVAGRLEHHVSRAAGHGWLLVGDAIEFIDPLTGEGLHRALVTAALAARAVDETLRGDRNALAVYDRRVRSRFRSKNVFSLVLQAFIADPRVLDYALCRLDRRASLRDELTAVLADQVRATHALDPRFLARLLAP
jgi:flavin-dependent dehydrogenase